jgi:origin recognition complex subunit 1
MCFRQSGLSEGNFGEVREAHQGSSYVAKVAKKHIELCRLYNIDPPSTSDLAAVCSSLAASHSILLEGEKTDLYSRIRLYISEEDITMTFRQDEDMRKFAL